MQFGLYSKLCQTLDEKKNENSKNAIIHSFPCSNKIMKILEEITRDFLHFLFLIKKKSLALFFLLTVIRATLPDARSCGKN